MRMISNNPSSNRHRFSLIVLFISAVAVRLLLIYACDPVLSNDSNGFEGPTYIPLSYRALAIEILNQDLSSDLGARSPGYSALMSASFYLFGVDNYKAIMLIQSFLGIIIFFAAYWLWSRIYGQNIAALIATAAAVLEPALIFFEGQIVSETLSVVLLLLSLALLISTVRRDTPSPIMAAFAGLCVAWLALTRPAFQMIIPLYTLYMVVVLRGNLRSVATVSSLLLFIFISILPVLGWNSYNYHRFGYFTLMTTQGYILTSHSGALINGQPQRYGEYSDLAGIMDNYFKNTSGRQAIWLAYPEIMKERQVTFVEASKLMQELSYKIFQDRPWEYLRSVRHAIHDFWSARLDAYREFDNTSYFRIFQSIYNLIHNFGVLLFVMVISMDLIRPRRWLEPAIIERMLIYGIVALVCLSSTVPIAVENARYKIPLHPLIWGIVASSLVRNWKSFRALVENWR